MIDSRIYNNFLPYDVPLKSLGIVYPTPEHFYQAMKTLDRKKRITISKAPTPKKAKQLGRNLKLREDWEEVKEYYMITAQLWKFRPNTEMRQALILSGIEEIIEWNRHHDNEWGRCMCSGCFYIEHKNKLGKILMELRSNLIAHLSK